MSNQATGVQRQATGVSDGWVASGQEGNEGKTPKTAHLLQSGGLNGIRPRWAGILAGRLILRVCPSRKTVCVHHGCHLRVFCKCAQAEWAAAGALENSFWLALAVCAAGVITYCFIRR
jgi:hypothetical protein